jgi:tetratricopeptide (TPR) repeat protein
MGRDIKFIRHMRMDMKHLKNIFSILQPRLSHHHDFGSVLKMYNKNDLSGAYASLCKVMENDNCWSKNGDVYTLWAELEILANHDPQKALEHLEKAKQFDRSEMGYYYNVYAKALWENGEHEKAIKYFDKGVVADPSVLQLSNLAWAYSFMRDKRAISVWQRVLEKDPENCFAHIFIGWEAAKSGDRDEALLMAKKAEKLNPSIGELPEIGRIYLELGEFQFALEKYVEAKRLGYDEDKEGILDAAIAECYISLGDATEAHKYIQFALQLDPKNEYVKEIWHDYQEKFGDQ